MPGISMSSTSACGAEARIASIAASPLEATRTVNVGAGR